MAIFQKDHIYGITDRMILNGWEFVAHMIVSDVSGNAAAIHFGRILVFQLSCAYFDDDEDEIIAYYDDGVWYQTADDYEEAKLVRDIFIRKYSKGGFDHGDQT